MPAIKTTIEALNAFWLGFRYSVVAIPEGLSLASAASTAGLASLGVSEVTFPTVSANIIRVPSLSNFPRYIPREITYSVMTLKAPTFRNQALWNRMENQVFALLDPLQYSTSQETIVVVEYDTSNTSPAGLLTFAATGVAALPPPLPIAAWICRGAQAATFTPAAANAQGGSVPLEQLTMQVSSIERL